MNQICDTHELDYGRLKGQLEINGTIMLPAGQLYSDAEVHELDALRRKLPEEIIHLGDAGESNDLFVARLMVDRPGKLPELVNQPMSNCGIDILKTSKRCEFFRHLFGRDLFLRRCQVNRMIEGSFIGYHLDTDSNPDYYVSVVIQLGHAYGNGEFVVYVNGKSHTYAPQFGSVIVSKCIYPHEVRRVTEGERISLVYFFSSDAQENRRQP